MSSTPHPYLFLKKANQELMIDDGCAYASIALVVPISIKRVMIFSDLMTLNSLLCFM